MLELNFNIFPEIHSERLLLRKLSINDRIDKLIGTICLWNINQENYSAEIGYELHPEWQGKGIMKEALSKIIDYGFQKMKLKEIEAFTNPLNDSSTRLLEKNNFKKKSILSPTNDGLIVKELVYSLSS